MSVYFTGPEAYSFADGFEGNDAVHVPTNTFNVTSTGNLRVQ
jgi:hypothetical protein